MPGMEHYNSTFREIYMYRHTPENQRVIAGLYWRVLLISASLLVIFSIVYGVYSIFSTSRARDNFISTVQVPSAAPTLDKAKLQSAIESFRARESRFETLKTNKPSIVDPSL